MTLTMIQLEPDMGRVVRWAEARRLLPGGEREDDLGYALHALTCAVFGQGTLSAFRLLQRPRRPVQLLAYSGLPRETLQRQAQLQADPADAEAIGLATLASKTMPADWPIGSQYRFEVRVRPTIRQDRDGDRKRAREVDAARIGEDRAIVYEQWLRARLARGGADLAAAQIEAIQSTAFQRRDAARTLCFMKRRPDVVFSGTIAIRDPVAFAQLIAHGVGRHRAFGFGMLLLRPAG